MAIICLFSRVLNCAEYMLLLSIPAKGNRFEATQSAASAIEAAAVSTLLI